MSAKQKTRQPVQAGDGQEIEFKLGVRRSDATRMAAAVMQLDAASRTGIRSLYFDTATDALAGEGISLRLREQSGRWVQTVKMRHGAGNRVRFEHEVDVPTPDGSAPHIDLRRHRGTPAGDRAIAVLAATPDAVGASLGVRYLSDVQRSAGRLRQGASTIEVAFDHGHVEASGRTLAVNELEFELKRGSTRTLIDATADWMRRGKTWFLHESKADRGLRLSHDEPWPAVAKASDVELDHAKRLGHLTCVVLGQCLEQILPNAAAIAEGSEEADHVHQLRVGLRRLRTALDELGVRRRDVSSIAPAVTAVFRTLGEHRDRQHVHEAVERQVLAETDATGAAWARSGDTRRVDLRALVRDTAFQLALLAVVRLADAGAGRGARRGGKSRRWLRQRLERLDRRVARCGKRFESLPTEAQHKVRKRLKRLSYLSEFAAPVFGRKQVRHYLRALEPAQDALGAHNDLAVARGMAAARAATDRDARLAVEWIEAAAVDSAREATRALRAAREATTFW